MTGLFLRFLCILATSLLIFIPVSFAFAPENVVVAGAGPAGLFFSLCYLSENPNACIQVFEKYPTDPRKLQISQSNAFGFGLGTRSQMLLRKIPNLMETIAEECGAPTSHGSYIVNRNELCSVLLNELEKRFGKRFQITFGARAESISVDEKANQKYVNMEMTNGDNQQIPYELLVGADGRNSAIRTSLADMGKLKVRQYLNSVFWKAMAFPSQSSSTIPSNAFLTYPPRGQRTSSDVGVLMPRYPNEHVALLFWKRSSGNKNPFGAKTAQDFKEGLLSHLPNIADFPSDEDIEYVLNEQETGTELWMKVDKHAIPDLGVALVGDAAHSMYSMFGQGCSCGLQGANMLSQSLTNPEATSMDDALAKFSKESRDEGHAISDLNLLSHWDGTRFLGRLRIWNFMKLMPLLGNAEVSYASIRDSLRWQVGLTKLLWRFQRISAKNE